MSTSGLVLPNEEVDSNKEGRIPDHQQPAEWCYPDRDGIRSELREGLPTLRRGCDWGRPFHGTFRSFNPDRLLPPIILVRFFLFLEDRHRASLRRWSARWGGRRNRCLGRRCGTRGRRRGRCRGGVLLHLGEPTVDMRIGRIDEFQPRPGIEGPPLVPLLEMNSSDSEQGFLVGGIPRKEILEGI